MDQKQPPPVGARASAPKKVLRLSITGLVLGILSLCGGFVVGIPGLICSIIGLNKISKSASDVGGRGIAIAGIVMSSLGIIFGTAIMVALALPTYMRIVETGREAALKQEQSDVL